MLIHFWLNISGLGINFLASHEWLSPSSSQIQRNEPTSHLSDSNQSRAK
jgi:hypothetical protein